MKDSNTNRMWLGTELYSGSFGQQYSYMEIKAIIDYCDDIDLDRIDTAECYGTDSSVEKMLGRALSGKRERFRIATKFGHRSKNGEILNDFGILAVKEQLENSLRNLQTDYIDVYYFHSGNNQQYNNADLWDFLVSKKIEGIICELGLSLRHSLVIDKDYEQLHLLDDFDITIVQTVLNTFSQQSLEYVIPYCRANDIRLVGGMPLAKGLLSGKYHVGHQFAESDQRSITDSLTQTIISSNEKSTVTDALDWNRKQIEEIVIGSRNQQQLLMNYSLINQ